MAFSNSNPFKAPVDLKSLEFHFTALDFSAPDEVQFRHKLEGNDPDWVDDAGTRSARYGKLPYGRYLLRVAARTTDGKWQEASTHFEEALRLRPQDSLAHESLGMILASQGKWDEAALHLRQAIAISPRLSSAHHNLAVVLMNQGKTQEAEKELALSYNQQK